MGHSDQGKAGNRSAASSGVFSYHTRTPPGWFLFVYDIMSGRLGLARWVP